MKVINTALRNIDWTSFTQTRILGSGTFGFVYQRQYKNNHSTVYNFAVKELVNVTTITEFIRELAALMTLQGSPYIVALQAVSIDTHQLYLELADINLMYYIKYNPDITLTPSDNSTSVSQLMHDIASGLQFMHRKYLFHRDLKPDNVLLFYDRSTQRFSAKITDFGLCRRILPSDGDNSDDDDSQFEDMSRPMYTLWYRGPEFLVVDRKDNAGWSACRVEYNPVATDVFALGMIFWDLLMYRKENYYDVLRCMNVEDQWMALQTYIRPINSEKTNYQSLMTSVNFNKACRKYKLQRLSDDVRVPNMRSVRKTPNPRLMWNELHYNICRQHTTWPLLLWKMLSFSPYERPSICEILATLGYEPQNCDQILYKKPELSSIKQRIDQWRQHIVSDVIMPTPWEDVNELFVNIKWWMVDVPTYIQPFANIFEYMLNTPESPYSIVTQYMKTKQMDGLQLNWSKISTTDHYFNIIANLFWLYGVLKVIVDYRKYVPKPSIIPTMSCFGDQQIVMARSMILDYLNGNILQPPDDQ